MSQLQGTRLLTKGGKKSQTMSAGHRVPESNKRAWMNYGSLFNLYLYIYCILLHRKSKIL